MLSAKSPTNWSVQIAGMIFQTYSNLLRNLLQESMEVSLHIWGITFMPIIEIPAQPYFSYFLLHYLYP